MRRLPGKERDGRRADACPRRGRALLSWLMLVALVSGSSGGARAESFSDLDVRAVYLYNFAIFVDWPETAFEGTSSPLRYCVLGTQALRANVERVIKGETVAGRPLELIPADTPEDRRRCHLIYIDHTAQSQSTRLLSEARGRPVLTIGDAERFAHQGGMISVVRRSGRLHTLINRGAVADTGIRISSKLLQIATLVSSDSSEATP